MAAIMSGFLQHWRLKPDQLQDNLPDYIPATLQNNIMHSFKELTLQLMPFPPYDIKK